MSVCVQSNMLIAKFGATSIRTTLDSREKIIEVLVALNRLIQTCADGRGALRTGWPVDVPLNSTYAPDTHTLTITAQSHGQHPPPLCSEYRIMTTELKKMAEAAKQMLTMDR